MRIHTCFFCSSPIYPGHGMMFVRNDCKVFRFCRKKCRRNFELKRNPRKVRWTKAFRKAHHKEIAVDSTFEFEKRRNRPAKYDREVMAKTIRAMKRVSEIRSKREERFHESRMKAARTKELKEAKMELEKNIDLVAPAASRQRAQINQRQAEKAAAKAARAVGAGAGAGSGAGGGMEEEEEEE
mmetsp:Transcript_10891/g.34702  ORF Transcript_10891/g.34702 Transcript_10891/m.34702 type:complete len:183 (-) Transcript_10891:29-577(-)